MLLCDTYVNPGSDSYKAVNFAYVRHVHFFPVLCKAKRENLCTIFFLNN